MYGNNSDLVKMNNFNWTTIVFQTHSSNSRKTYISTLIDGKININTVREMVGHADKRTTLKNYTFDVKTKSEKNKMIENALDYVS